jgi:hypothetical protein
MRTEPGGDTTAQVESRTYGLKYVTMVLVEE